MSDIKKFKFDFSKYLGENKSWSLQKLGPKQQTFNSNPPSWKNLRSRSATNHHDVIEPHLPLSQTSPESKWMSDLRAGYVRILEFTTNRKRRKGGAGLSDSVVHEDLVGLRSVVDHQKCTLRQTSMIHNYCCSLALLMDFNSLCHGFFYFSTFDTDKLGKIRQHHCKERFKISTIV